MVIKLTNREKLTQEKLKSSREELAEIYKEFVVQIKSGLKLFPLDYLYEVRDYIDELIVNWEADPVIEDNPVEGE